MKVYIASDHAGYALKGALVPYLEVLGHEVTDMGAATLDDTDDYPTFILPCAEKVAAEAGAFGIVIGGSGQGEAMAANRVKGVRAAVYYGQGIAQEAVSIDASPPGIFSAGGDPDPYVIVRLPRQHNDANVLSFGARFVTIEEAQEAARIFLETPFSGDPRHVRRINEY